MQKSLKLVIKKKTLYDNYCVTGNKLVSGSYVDKRHLLHKIKELIDYVYDDINTEKGKLS